MARHVSWRAGGAVERAYTPADLTDLQVFLRTLGPQEPVCFVGLGSNLLVRDGGLRGCVVFTHRALSGLRLDAPAADCGEITAEAGIAAPKLARYAAMHDVVGAEFFAGIPGTVGGALAMNAGCYGGETWRSVVRVATIARSGEVLARSPDDFFIGYRSVALRNAGARLGVDEWFIGATFRFARGNGVASRRLMKDFLQRRIASQPLGEPNAGSVFRNPQGDYAARLIEACGLKGKRVGGAMISAKHANFIVNTGSASARDIEQLIAFARAAVRERFGIALETEVRVIGDAPAGAQR
jgi:UDP-N-acetylmuramate dehydrogenase